MKDNESDSESIKSGSCNCSEYNSDCSWFYDSRMLKKSEFHFMIENKLKSEKDGINNNNITVSNNIVEKEKEVEDDNLSTNSEKIGNTNEIENNSEKQQKNDSGKKQNDIQEEDKNDNNDAIKNNYNTQTFEEKSPKIIDIIKSDMKPYENRAKQINLKEKKHNNYNSSPDNKTNKSIQIFSLNNTKEESNLKKINIDSRKIFHSPKKTFSRSITTTNILSPDINKYKINFENVGRRNKNNKIRGRVIKEKVVKETKTITVEPGETIKPKTIGNRKLKPIKNIVKNEDGSQNIVTESTTLTTITENELLDSNQLYKDDNYPLDIQFVRQHITKIYKTEIENIPYLIK